MMPADVGTVVASKYLLLRLLGRGAMGEVWLSTHTTLGEKVAIKFLLHKEGPGEDDHATARKRFLFEAQAAAKLSRKSRHIVRVTDHGEDGDLTYFVMELLDGDSLDDFIKRAGPQPLAFAADIVNQTARGLVQAHGDGVFHRDLKPANIYLVKDEDERRLVKILDFGLARAYGSPHSTQRGIVLGSPSYMSPEQARGLPNLDYRCDLWALAVCAYKILTGELPFGAVSAEDALARIVMSDFTPARDHRPDLPWEVDSFFARAFSKSIEDRFENATRLATAFEKLVKTADAVAGPAATPPPVESSAKPAAVAAPRAEEPERRDSRHDSDGTQPGATTSQTGALPVRGLPRPLGMRLLLGAVVAVPAVLVLVYAGVLRSKSASSSPGALPAPTALPTVSVAVSAATAPAALPPLVAPAPSELLATQASATASTAAKPATTRPGPRATTTVTANTRATAPTSTATETAAPTATATRRGNKDDVF